MRGHIPGSRPLVLGSPPPGADEATVAELAKEVALRLRRHGITGDERLVLVDRGDGVGAMPAAQMAELAGHPRVAMLLGGMAGVAGRARGRARSSSSRCARRRSQPNAARVPDAAGARVAARRPIADDPRRPSRRRSTRASAAVACDPRQGHIPGAKHVEVERALRRPGPAASPEQIRALVGAARRRRGRRVLPLRLALGARDARAAQRRLRRAQLRRARGTSGRATTSCRSSASPS